MTLQEWKTGNHKAVLLRCIREGLHVTLITGQAGDLELTRLLNLLTVRVNSLSGKDACCYLSGHLDTHLIFAVPVLTDEDEQLAAEAGFPKAWLCVLRHNSRYFPVKVQHSLGIIEIHEIGPGHPDFGSARKVIEEALMEENDQRICGHSG